MALRDVTRSAVLSAISEHDRLGAEDFRERYGFGPALVYHLVYDGRVYDSKAIVGVAHGFVGDRPWRSSDFTGGEQTVGRLLHRLGFDVRSRRNPHWTRDELILACALVERNGWKGLSYPDPQVIELSEFLQRMPIHEPFDRGEKFRSPDSVGRKTSDIATAHPDYGGIPTHGGQLDREVLAEFLSDPARMHTAAAAIRAMVESGAVDDLVADEDLIEDDVAAPEGRLLLRQHFTRERSQKLRKKKLDETRRETGRLACEACGFDFEQTYGNRGAGYIECHHVVPLHEAGEGRTKVDDLALLCSNCHRIVHRRAPWLTPAELADLLGQRTAQAGN